MMSDDFRQFLTPHPPLIRFCPISAHALIIWRPILTLRPPLSPPLLPPFDLYVFLANRRSPKICLFLSLFCPKHNFTIGWNISEAAFLFNEPESHWKSKKVYDKRNKNSWNIGPPIFAFLPTPLVPFRPISLDPPSPPKIGHHLCTFPNAVHAQLFGKPINSITYEQTNKIMVIKILFSFFNPTRI